MCLEAGELIASRVFVELPKCNAKKQQGMTGNFYRCKCNDHLVFVPDNYPDQGIAVVYHSDRTERGIIEDPCAAS